MIKPTPQRVLIEWSDIVDGGGEWHHGEEPLKPVLVRTIGFVLSKTKKHIVVARDYYFQDGKRVLGGRLAIPLGCVERITPLVAKA